MSHTNEKNVTRTMRAHRAYEAIAADPLGEAQLREKIDLWAARKQGATADVNGAYFGVCERMLKLYRLRLERILKG